jgi:hypothetical protein
MLTAAVQLFLKPFKKPYLLALVVRHGHYSVQLGTRLLVVIWFCCGDEFVTSVGEQWHRMRADGVTYAKFTRRQHALHTFIRHASAN